MRITVYSFPLQSTPFLFSFIDEDASSVGI